MSPLFESLVYNLSSSTSRFWTDYFFLKERYKFRGHRLYIQDRGNQTKTIYRKCFYFKNSVACCVAAHFHHQRINMSTHQQQVHVCTYLTEIASFVRGTRIQHLASDRKAIKCVCSVRQQTMNSSSRATYAFSISKTRAQCISACIRLWFG